MGTDKSKIYTGETGRMATETGLNVAGLRQNFFSTKPVATLKAFKRLHEAYPHYLYLKSIDHRY